ncbi:MAG TPA: pyridoxal phosphate-dependent aminotransferase [Gammaproteobacteria bacterium]|nr:pyridoxal phosphate-dependent aminotransferase [Gammaproteobacteria bacterium]
MTVASKLPNVGTTIFTVMSRLAAEHGAINLSQGFPDFDGPPPLLERVSHYLHNGHNQYAHMAGVPALREQIARKAADLYGCPVDPETEVTVTSGATEALFCAITALVRPGDEVILFDPAYDSYQPAVDLCGGISRRLPLLAPSFKPDWQRLRDSINDRTRLLVLNTPHNPSGSIWDASDIETLRELVRNHDLYLLADEVYEHIVFDGRRHESLLRYPDLYARSLVVSSFGKTYHTTGWKLGYCIAPPALTLELRRIHQYVTFSSNTPIQFALADYMAAAPEHALGLSDFYQAKRDHFCRLLQGSRFRFTPAAGTYFQLLDYSEISDENDVDLATRLTKEHRVASIPISVFYAEPPPTRLLRFCFAKDDRTLERAAEILCAL